MMGIIENLNDSVNSLISLIILLHSFPIYNVFRLDIKLNVKLNDPATFANQRQSYEQVVKLDFAQVLT